MKKVFYLLAMTALFLSCSNDSATEFVTDKKEKVETQSRKPQFVAPVLMNAGGGGLNTSNTFNVLFLAEGFTSTQMSDFVTLSVTARDAILDMEPFASHSDHINFYRAETPSVQSTLGQYGDWSNYTESPVGCSGYVSGNDTNQLTNWKVKTHRVGLVRYLGVSKTARDRIETEYGYLQGNDYVHVIIITNTKKSVLGSQGAWLAGAEFPGVTEHNDILNPKASVSIISRYDDGADFKYLARHEFAHSFGDLADEYENDSNNTHCSMHNYESHFIKTPPRANVLTYDPTPNSTSTWVEGARYQSTGLFRESNNSLMRTGWGVTVFSPAQLTIVRARFVTATGTTHVW